MEIILIGGYLLIGIIKAINRLSDTNPARKPTWANLNPTPGKVIFYCSLYALLWPLMP